MLKARLPNPPTHPLPVIALLESLSLWYGRPLRAVIDADAEDVRRHPERWAMLLGDGPELAVACGVGGGAGGAPPRPLSRHDGRVCQRPQTGVVRGDGASDDHGGDAGRDPASGASRGLEDTNSEQRRFAIHHSASVRRAIADAPERATAPPVASALEPFKPYLVERLTLTPELSVTRLLLESLRYWGYPRRIAKLRRTWPKSVPRGPRKPTSAGRDLSPGRSLKSTGLFFCTRASAKLTHLFPLLRSCSRGSRAFGTSTSRSTSAWSISSARTRGRSPSSAASPQGVIYVLKSVVLHHVGTTVQFNPAFLAFGGHPLFEPVAAPVRYPQAEGNLEGAINSTSALRFSMAVVFMTSRTYAPRSAAGATKWPGPRVHATTRERPADRLLLEKTRLRALPAHPFDTDSVVPIVVSKEARVHLDTNSYSVPHTLVGRTVHLRANDATVRVVADGEVVAEHPRRWDSRRAIESPAHIDALLAKRPGLAGLAASIGSPRSRRKRPYTSKRSHGVASTSKTKCESSFGCSTCTARPSR